MASTKKNGADSHPIYKFNITRGDVRREDVVKLLSSHTHGGKVVDEKKKTLLALSGGRAQLEQACPTHLKQQLAHRFGSCWY